MRDRFGPLPKAAKRMLNCAKIKVSAKAANIKNITTRKERVLLTDLDNRTRTTIQILRAEDPDARLEELILILSFSGE